MRMIVGLLGLSISCLVAACGEQSASDGGTPGGGSDAGPPEYDVLFPDGEVLRLDVTIDAADWEAMRADLTDMLGEFGAGGGTIDPGGGGGGGGGGMDLPAEATEACVGLAEGDACSFEIMGMALAGTCEVGEDGATLVCTPEIDPGGGDPGGGDPGGGDPGGGVDLLPRTPIWVPCTLVFKEQVYSHVGIRFKGNSTLSNSWSGGIGKLPYRIKMDEFEDTYPEIQDQRLHGFQSLSLASNVMDTTFLKDKVVADVLREAGVPAARTVFVRLYVDTGEGPTYHGLYTMIEVPDGPLLDAQLGGSGGNLYKPEADWTAFDEASFEKQNHEDAMDWSDVQAAINALHADRTDAASWRAGLEEAFDAAGFLRWLAANTILSNWDTYGMMAHNYYLYSAPADGGRLHWIPWDHDLSFSGGAADSTMQETIGESWPLIRYLLDDPTYRQLYVDEMRAFLDGPFAVGAIDTRLEAERDLIDSAVRDELPEYTALTSATEFDESFATLVQFVNDRREAVNDELASQP